MVPVRPHQLWILRFLSIANCGIIFFGPRSQRALLCSSNQTVARMPTVFLERCQPSIAYVETPQDGCVQTLARTSKSLSVGIIVSEKKRFQLVCRVFRAARPRCGHCLCPCPCVSSSRSNLQPPSPSHPAFTHCERKSQVARCVRAYDVVGVDACSVHPESLPVQSTMLMFLYWDVAKRSWNPARVNSKKLASVSKRRARQNRSRRLRGTSADLPANSDMAKAEENWGAASPRWSGSIAGTEPPEWKLAPHEVAPNSTLEVWIPAAPALARGSQAQGSKRE